MGLLDRWFPAGVLSMLLSGGGCALEYAMLASFAVGVFAALVSLFLRRAFPGLDVFLVCPVVGGVALVGLFLLVVVCGLAVAQFRWGFRSRSSGC
jgi:hypothetical protein